MANLTERGSPPHRRGKVLGDHFDDIRNRITPAQAGKRLRPKFFILSGWDHPRTGGEKIGTEALKRIGEGSPPHRRGKDLGAQHPERGRWITPAQAGKSGWSASKKPPGRDHPRTGGEKWFRMCAVPNALGSPPHRRGKATFPAIRLF